MDQFEYPTDPHYVYPNPVSITVELFLLFLLSSTVCYLVQSCNYLLLLFVAPIACLYSANLEIVHRRKSGLAVSSWKLAFVLICAFVIIGLNWHR